MALSAKVSAFNIDTTKTLGQTQAVTGVGFTPKVLIFWWCGSTNSADEVVAGTTRFGYGYTTSSAQFRCLTGISIDAQGTSDTGKSMRDDSCIAILSTTSTMDGKMTLSTFDSDGFTLTVTDQFASAYRIGYLALGGTDITNAKAGTYTTVNTTGNQSTTDPGFRPTGMLTGWSLSGINAITAQQNISLGMASGASNDCVVTMFDRDNLGTTDTTAYGYEGEVEAMSANSDSVLKRGEFTSFDATGFTINWTENTGNDSLFYLAIGGIQVFVGSLLTQTDTITDITETVGFQPRAVLMASVNRAVSTQNTGSPPSKMTIGAFSSISAQNAMGVWSEDNVGDSRTALAVEHDNCYVNVLNDALEASMAVTDVSSTGFTCRMTNADASAMWVEYMAFGDSAGNPWYAYAQQ